MSNTVDISWLRDRLKDVAGISEAQAGHLIGLGMAKGDLNAVAPVATCRPENLARHHSEDDLVESDYQIPQYFWQGAQVDWSERKPYFRFFYLKSVWLSPELYVPRASALAFIQANDPLRERPQSRAAEAVADPAENRKGSGGRARTHDWAAAAGALAGHLYIEGRQSHADLTRFVQSWFQAQRGRAPDAREVERFVTEALRTFESATPDG